MVAVIFRGLQVARGQQKNPFENVHQRERAWPSESPLTEKGGEHPFKRADHRRVIVEGC